MRLKTALLNLTQCELAILLAYSEGKPPDPAELFRIENPVVPDEKLYAFARLHELGLLQGGMPPDGESGDIRADMATLTCAGHDALRDSLGYNDACSSAKCANALRAIMKNPTVQPDEQLPTLKGKSMSEIFAEISDALEE